MKAEEPSAFEPAGMYHSRDTSGSCLVLPQPARDGPLQRDVPLSPLPLDFSRKQPAPGPGIINAFEKATKRWIEPLRKLSRLSFQVTIAGMPDGVTEQDLPPVCKAMQQGEFTCSRCRQTHQQLRSRALLNKRPEQTVCSTGLSLFVIPVISGSRAVGWIEGGRAFPETPGEQMFEKLEQSLGEKNETSSPQDLRTSYFATPVVSAEAVSAVIDLLRFVSASIVQEAEEVAFASDHNDPPAIARARELVGKGYGSKLGIAIVAREVCLSEDHFSKLFKRVTGVAFTEYVGRVRVGHAQRLLTTTRKQIAEVAFECGFESIPHFNRMFKRFAGMAPTVYRASKQGKVAY